MRDAPLTRSTSSCASLKKSDRILARSRKCELRWVTSDVWQEELAQLNTSGLQRRVEQQVVEHKLVEEEEEEELEIVDTRPRRAFVGTTSAPKETFESSRAGQAVLTSEQHQHRPLNVVSVCGKLGTGKSYLMNALAPEPVFGVSDQSTGFTQGIDVCSRLMPCSHFSGSVSEDGEPVIAFVDAEGQGDCGLQYDVKLACPCLLVSKVLILNVLCPARPVQS